MVMYELYFKADIKPVDIFIKIIAVLKLDEQSFYYKLITSALKN